METVEKALFSSKYQHLLAWLRLGREARGWSIRDLAREVGESHAVIGKIETGERRLDVFEYVQLCEALGLKAVDGVRLLEGP